MSDMPNYSENVMTTAFTSTEKNQRGNVNEPRRRAPEVTLARDTTEGAFSLFDDEPLTIAAEKGLVIRVQSGCLWVPSSDEHCSVGVSEGERFVCKRNETLRVLGCRGTRVDLEWPTRARLLISVH